MGGEEQRERHLFDAEERTSATPRVKKRLDLPASELKRYPKNADHDAEAPGRRALLTKQPAQFMRLPATSPFDAAARRGVATLAAVSVLGGSLFGSPGS